MKLTPQFLPTKLTENKSILSNPKQVEKIGDHKNPDKPHTKFDNLLTEMKVERPTEEVPGIKTDNKQKPVVSKTGDKKFADDRDVEGLLELPPAPNPFDANGIGEPNAKKKPSSFATVQSSGLLEKLRNIQTPDRKVTPNDANALLLSKYDPLNTRISISQTGQIGKGQNINPTPTDLYANISSRHSLGKFNKLDSAPSEITGSKGLDVNFRHQTQQQTDMLAPKLSANIKPVLNSESSSKNSLEHHKSPNAMPIKHIPVQILKAEDTAIYANQKSARTAPLVTQAVTLNMTKLETPKSSSDLNVAAASAFETGSSPLIKPTEISDFIRNLVADMKRSAKVSMFAEPQSLNASSSLKTIQVNLYPRDLGAVEITIKLAGDNASISIKAQSQVALTLIQNDLEAIQKSVQASGQNLDEIQISRLVPNNALSEHLKQDLGFTEDTPTFASNHAESGQESAEDRHAQGAENKEILDFQVENESPSESTDSRVGIYM